MYSSQEKISEYKYDTVKILELLQSISLLTDSLELQSKINVYLKDLLESRFCLMVPLLSASSEGLIQVINSKTLEKEIRFSVSN